MFHEQGRFSFEQSAFTSRAGVAQPGFSSSANLDDTRIGAFASTIARPLKRLQITAGVRVDYAAINDDAVVSPRLSAAYTLTPRWQLTGSAGLFHQAVPLFIAAQNDDNRSLKHLQARHLIAGVEYLLTADTRLTLEAYDKQYRNMPELAPGNPLGDPSFVLDNRGGIAGRLVSTGEAYARGVDAMNQKKLAQKLYGLVSVSVFRSRYTDRDGNERSRLFDTRTLFNVIGGYKPNDIWELSIRWSYSGGRPSTPIDVAASQALGTEVWDVARVNAVRLPAYHALFVRADRRFNFRNANLVTFLSLWNAYSRANVDDYYWNVDASRVDERNQFSLLPVAGVEFEF